MGRRAWTWGAGLLAFGVVIMAVSLHSVLTFDPSAGSQQTMTLGQIVGLLVGIALLVAAALVLGTGLRRRLEVRRLRRLRDRLGASLDLPG